MTDVTAPDPGDLALAAEFPAVTRQQWQRLVAKVVGEVGAEAPEQELVTVTADGIEIAPLYVKDAGRPAPGYPGRAPYVRGRTAAGHRAGWDVRQRHEHPDPAVAREQIMEDLEGGVSSLWLGLGGGGVPVGALPDVLADVYLDLAPVVLDAGERFTEAAEVFLGAAAKRGVPISELSPCPGPALRRRCPRSPRDRRRRAAVPRRRRHRGAGTRLRPGGGAGVPAGDAPGGTVGRGGVRAARVPLCGDRRPVHDDRQTARRPPGLGARGRAVRRRPRGGGTVAARRELLADADPQGPLE